LGAMSEKAVAVASCDTHGQRGAVAKTAVALVLKSVKKDEWVQGPYDLRAHEQEERERERRWVRNNTALLQT
jgi:hypothetical protein